MERVELPVRGEYCEHLQCFSLSAYLFSNRKMRAFNNRWVCPLCSLTLRPRDLRLDTYIKHILAKSAPEAEEVTMLLDGSWTGAASEAASPPQVAPTSGEAGMIGADLESAILTSATVNVEVLEIGNVTSLSKPNAPERQEVCGCVIGAQEKGLAHHYQVAMHDSEHALVNEVDAEHSGRSSHQHTPSSFELRTDVEIDAERSISLAIRDQKTLQKGPKRRKLVLFSAMESIKSCSNDTLKGAVVEVPFPSTAFSELTQHAAKNIVDLE
jgi:hypothetical protein